MNGSSEAATEARQALLDALLEEEGLSARERDRVPRRTGSEPPPLSFAQQRIWFLDRLKPGNPFYNCDTTITIAATVSSDVLLRAVNALIARHEALRTTFSEVDGKPVQIITPELEIPLERRDLRDHPSVRQETEALRVARELAAQPFDLETGPLVRTALITLEETRHYLVLITHHIISDGWSLGILVRELREYYTAFATGTAEPNLAELPIQYADFAVWQRQWLTGERLEQQVDYWKGKLDGLRPLALPTDHPRPPIPTFEGSFESFGLPRTLSDRLRTLAREESATMFMVLLAAFKVLLSRYSGAADIAVGSPIANRTRSELESVVGFFVNTLVMRTSIDGDLSFRQILRRVRETAMEAYSNQDLPFEKLVEELQPERDLSRNPLFQVTFQLFNVPASDRTEANLSEHSSLVEIQRGTSKFDLRLDTWESPDGLRGQLEYSTDLFDRGTIVQMICHLRALLDAVAADPDRPLAEIELLSADEKKRILSDWNQTATAYPAERSIEALFARRAAASPEAVAIDAGEVRLTYGELAERSDRLAGVLAGAGVELETPVGVHLERSSEFVVCVLAILKAGGAFVPLDPSYPPTRLALMLEDTGAPLVLTDRRHREALPATTARVVLVESLAQEPAETPPRLPHGGDRLAYIMYTSGSTGRPKGVCVPHRAVVRLALETDFLELESEDVVAHLSNVSFDASTFEIWNTLLAGARLLVIDRDDALVAPRLKQKLRDSGVTAMFITTALFNQVTEKEPDVFSGLDVLLVGGSLADPSRFRRVLEKGPPGQLLHVYGPTENTTFSTYYILPAPPPDGRPLPIGRPIANSTAYVLDHRLRPVPIGVTGDLYVGGDGLARGYWRNPGLTAERFVPHPFSADGERLYRTGDRARQLAGGNIDFLGREDHQVKIRGFRVELDEVDLLLARQEGVREVVSVIREDVPNDRRIVSYVCCREPASDPTARGDEESLLVDQWQRTYDEMIYGRVTDHQGARRDPTFDTSGWVSSYTGRPLPEEEMREQVEGTVKRIAATRPQRVMEIGCGIGLLLFRLAQGAERYVGTDISQVAIDYLRRELKRQNGAYSGVRLLLQSADSFDALAPGSFDTVILNSVVQYFPSLDYLRRVIAGAARCLTPDGVIFVGDVRNLALLRSLHTSIELSQAADSMSVSRLEERARTRMEHEQELVLAPEFFLGLGDELDAVASVRIEQKRGRFDNELTRYRYDVWIHLGEGDDGAPRAVEWPWRPGKSDLAALRAKLTSERPDRLLVRGIPNRRLRLESAALRLLGERRDLETVGELRATAEEQKTAAVHPEDVWTLADGLPYEALVCWSPGDTGERFDALFVASDPEVGSPAVSFPAAPCRRAADDELATDPIRGRFRRSLVPSLRSAVLEELPDFMHPSAYVLLSAFPLTPNGKIDRAALPAPYEVYPAVDATDEPLRGEIEEAVAKIWASVLGLDNVGRKQNFFTHLGGNSLLATQVVSQIREQLRVEVPLRHIFESPTVAELSTIVDRLRTSDARGAQAEVAQIERAGGEAGLDVDELSESAVDALLEAMLEPPRDEP